MPDMMDDRNKAAELYAQARELELGRDYAGARRCYEQSLKLYEDEEVRAAYLRLLATIGPM
jgi:rubrerythrin